MTRIRIRRGLDVPLAGPPAQEISDGPDVRSVAVLGPDYVGLRPRLLVGEGDTVTLGQALFEDRRHPRIRVTSPGCGVVASIQRGDRRALQSIVIRLVGDAEEKHATHAERNLLTLPRDDVVETLLASGLWTAIRSRPFGRVPDPDGLPPAVFVTAIDTNPLAADPEVVIAAQSGAFAAGLAVVSRLVSGPIQLCKSPGADVPDGGLHCVVVTEFAGPHPAGLVGTHVHTLAPVGRSKSVWHLGYQDVIAIGKLFTTGRLWTERVVALAGPLVARPRLIRTRLGANTDDLVVGELHDGPRRVVSGSVLSGREATGPVAYLGRYHAQVSVLREAGADDRAVRYSAAGLFGTRRRRRRLPLTTAVHGPTTFLYPLGTYERVMPLDVLATPLLRALLVGDVERALDLGCLELDEEDLALCTFVCPSKIDHGANLREVLTRIEREG